MSNEVGTYPFGRQAWTSRNGQLHNLTKQVIHTARVNTLPASLGKLSRCCFLAATPIKVWVTPEEKAAIAAKADAHSLSASSYLRRLGLAMPLQSTIDQQAILDLVKINADLGRFGGLIKMWLTTNADFESVSAQGLQRKLESTLSDVRQLQKKMSDRLEDL